MELVLRNELNHWGWTKRLLAAARAFASDLFAARKALADGFRMSGSAAVSSSAARADANEIAVHLLDAYGKNILRLAYSYLHNMADSEEVVQDTLMQYLKEMPDFTDAEHEKKWCLRVAGNLSKNRIKYNRIRISDELNEELVGEEREDLSFVWEAVKSLPEKYRETVHLFYQEGYTTAEIASILGRNEATVRSHLARGREQLKSILKEAYDFGG